MTQNTRGTGTDSDRIDRSALHRRLLVLPFCVAVFSGSALFYYHWNQASITVESPLQVVYAAIYRTFGFAPSLMFFLLLLVWTSIWFFTGRIERPWTRLLRLAATMVILGIFLNVGREVAVAPHQGELGALLASRLVAAFGFYPMFILMLVATLGALLLATDFLFSEAFERLWTETTVAGKEADGGAADEGVEVAVTEHFKQLAGEATGAAGAAATIAATGAGASIGRRPAGRTAASAVLHEPETFEFADQAVAPEVEPEVEDPLPDVEPRRERRERRRSYFERRQAARAEAGEDEADVWVPSAPEAQEIDNPEIRAASPVDPASAEDGSAGGDAGAEFVAAIGDSPEFGVDEELGVDGELAVDGEIGDDQLDAESAVAAEAPQDGEEDAHESADADGAAVGEDDAVDDDDTAEEDGEPVFAIPRPARDPAARPASSYGQQRLFGADIDEDLLDEAKQVVLETRRASAAFLRRRLRIGYEEACEVLAELSARGVVELDDDASQGRVRE